MIRLQLRSANSLLELATVLVILAVLAAISVPALRHARDVYATRAARDALAAGIDRTRAAAISAGGARLVVDVASGRFWIETATGSVLRGADLDREFRVSISAGAGTPGTVQLRFDGIGIGRMTSRTFTFRRGRAQARLVVSAYGRLSW
jgi:Tfp pilus assembly protein FimT